MTIENALKIAKSFLGDDVFKNIHLSYSKNDNPSSFSIVRNGNNVVISYGQLVHLFYGLTLLKENIDQKEFSINLSNRFLHNGLMHDCSRNAVMNINQVKQMILVHALMGLNRFMLYTEDTYEIEGEPYFGYFRGRYTKKELTELVDYAESFGVELVPCIQTLSHLNQMMRWTGKYAKIQTSPGTLKIGEEETYVFIEKMIKTVSETFHTKVIHIGMDEAIDIGLNDFLQKDVAANKKELMLSHLKRVIAICDKYSLKPMMWEDMFFKIDPKATPDWYDFKGKLADDVKKEIPKNVELVYWDYYHNDVQTYDKMIKISQDTGNNVIFASGMIRWIGFVPHFNYSFLKCRAGLKAALKNKVNSLIATTWGDGGGEGTVISSYPFLALHSLFDYYGTASNGMMNKLLKAVTSQSLKEWYMLQLPNEITGQELLPFENPSKPFLYNDPLLGMFDTRALSSYDVEFKKHAKTLKKESKKSKYFGYAYRSLADLCDLLSIKTTLGKNARLAYKAHDIEGLKKSLENTKLCIKKLDKFILSYREQWYKENKVFGNEVTDGRLGFLKQRLETMIWTLDKYLSNQIASIPEFEEDVLPYNNAKDDEPHCYNYWEEIVSPSVVK